MSAAGQGASAASSLHSGDPTDVGGYRLVGRLGRGGQGVVFLGQGPGGEKVAVKLLHASFGTDPTARARFAREAETARRVASYSTAQVLAADFEGSQPYVVSEFIDGPSLLDYVRSRGPQQGAALTRLAIGTLAALLAVHRAGIVHRDFKPANVLLPPEGPRVVDFGIARVLEATSTLTSQVIGTPGYMAPEQLGGEPVTPATDMFAWGATMAYAATGSPPFGADSVAAVIGAVLHGEPDLTGLDGPLRPVVVACLAKHPAGRPGAADLLARLLDGTLEPDGPRAPAAGVVPDMPERTLLDAANRAVTDLANAPTATALSPPPSPRPTVPPTALPPAPRLLPAPDRPSRRGLLIAGGVAVAGALGTSLWLANHGGGSKDRRKRWAHTVRGNRVVGITATADTVCFAPEGAGVQALDAATGKPLWTQKGETSSLLRSGTILVTVDGGKLKALDMASGQTRWSASASRLEAGRGVVAVAGDAVVTAEQDANIAGRDRRALVWAVGLADGGRRWSRRLAGSWNDDIGGDLGVVASEKVVAVLGAQSVHALDARTGRELWHARLAAAGTDHALMLREGVHAVVGDTLLIGWGGIDGAFRAFNATTGVQRWHTRLIPSNAPALATDAHTVYVCGGDPGGDGTKTVRALDTGTGRRRWSFASGEVTTWGPIGGLVFATNEDTGIWALDTRRGRTVWDIGDMAQPTALAGNDTTAFLAAGGDDGANQTIHALRLTT